MPTPPLSREKAQQAVDAVNAAIAAGYAYPGSPSAIVEAARALGVNEKTLWGRIYTAKLKYGIEPTAEPPVREVVFTEPAKPRVIVRAASEAAPEGQAIRLLLIGDTHVAPGQNLDRFKWFARHVGETRPDKVIQIGDLGEFASVSTHERPGSLPQKLRPSFMNDLDSVAAALSEYDREAPSDIPRFIVLGNHEERIKTFETGNAEMEGALWPQFDDVLARYNWRPTSYKRYLFIGGCGLTHVPMTLLDRPYGGKTLNPLGNELLFSLIFGHTHRFAFLNVPKIGPQRSIQILNVGSAMPHGYYPSYNPSEQGAYTYGVVEATVQAGRIVQHHFIPMRLALASIAFSLAISTAYPHDIWSRAREYNRPEGFPCCGGDPMTGDCEGLTAEDIWDQPDGSVIVYSHRYKARILVGAKRVHTDVPRDVNTKEPLDELTRYEAHYCGKPRGTSFGYNAPPDDAQSDPTYWTFCFFRNAGGS